MKITIYGWSTRHEPDWSSVGTTRNRRVALKLDELLRA
jgi:hypothetical protein